MLIHVTKRLSRSGIKQFQNPNDLTDHDLHEKAKNMALHVLLI